MTGAEIFMGVCGLLTASSSVWGYMSSRRASRVEREMPRLTAEAAAFTLAKDHYVNIINELEEHVSWLKAALADRAKENSELRHRITELEDALKNLRVQFEAAVEALRNQSVVMVKQIED